MSIGNAIYGLLQATIVEESHVQILKNALNALHKILDMPALFGDAMTLWYRDNVQRYSSQTKADMSELLTTEHLGVRRNGVGEVTDPVQGVLGSISTLWGLEDALVLGQKRAEAIRRGVVPILALFDSSTTKDHGRVPKPVALLKGMRGQHRPPLCLQNLLQNRLVRLRFLRAINSSGASQ